MTELTIDTARGAMPCYLARPAGAGPWPAVVVIHDALGMSTDLRAQADWLAGEGFLAIAPDLYYWGRKITCMVKLSRDANAPRGDLEAARTWLAESADCTGSIGMIGYCMGGGIAMAMAPREGWAAASVNYGTLPSDPEAALAGACPIVASYGGRDKPLRGSAERLEKALDANGVPHDVREYADANHGFLNDHDPADVSPFFRVVFRLYGTGYHPESAADARERIAAFFRSHLG